MKLEHITQILDQQKFSELSEEALMSIHNHNLDCSECLKAFKAAQISAVLLKSNLEINTISPYFQSKVLNAWREKQNIRKPVAAFVRWWQASATLVLTMLMTVVSLILFTVVAQTENSVAIQKKTSSEYNLYSTDSVILNQKPPKNLTTEQAFEILESNKLTQNRK